MPRLSAVWRLDLQRALGSLLEGKSSRAVPWLASDLRRLLRDSGVATMEQSLVEKAVSSTVVFLEVWLHAFWMRIAVGHDFWHV